ncbi:MAG: DRTGG domain-containing protein, partial [Spirochaetota bacterium]
LASPTIRQLMEDVKGELICGEQYLDEAVSNIIVGAMPPHTALDYFKGEVLLITPGNREDLILAALACSVSGIQEDYSVKGIILTGGIWPQRTVLRLLQQSGIPTIILKDDTFETAQKITNLIIKIRPEDDEKINIVKQMIKKYIIVDELIERIKQRR